MDNGWVKKWNKNSKNVWNSPLLAVPKQSGGVNEADDIRLCINLQKVNSKLKEPIYTLPTPVKMFRMVGDVKFFTEIDLSSAYHHIKVEEDSQPLLGFVNPQGIQYVWMRLSFDPKGVVIHFQTQGEKTILRIKDVISYLDNFLVTSQTFKSHCESVKRVIEALTEAGFWINCKKYKFLMKKLKFMDHLIDGNSHSIDSHKMKVVAKIACPVTEKQVE